MSSCPSWVVLLLMSAADIRRGGIRRWVAWPRSEQAAGESESEPYRLGVGPGGGDAPAGGQCRRAERTSPAAIP